MLGHRESRARQVNCRPFQFGDCACKALYANAQGALSILFEAAKQTDSLIISEADQSHLKVAFNEIEGYISIQQSSTLMRALDFAEKAIFSGEGANVISLPETERQSIDLI